MPAPRQKFASLLIGLVGVGGFLLMLVLSVQHPSFAIVLRVMAVVWLLGFGLMRLVVDLTEDDRASSQDDSLFRSGAFDFTRDYR